MNKAGWVKRLQYSIHILLWWVMVGWLTGCALAQAPTTPTVALPTLAPTPLPEAYQLSGAEDIVRRFLDAWNDFDYATMHSLISFTARDTTPLADFIALYEDVQAELTLEAITFTPVTLVREQPSVVAFVYHATFDTLVLGNIEDPNRTLHLVIDPIDLNWRVAWSAGDIFQELGTGGALRLEYIVPRRANIYDRNGELLADMNGRMVVLNLVKGRIPLYDECLTTLALALDQPSEQVLGTLDRFGADWLAEVGLLEPPAYLQYEADLVTYCGATFDSRAVRQYIDGSLMPNILGTVGYPSEAELDSLRRLGFPADAIIGRTGIEASWDTTLRGVPGGRLSIVQGQNVVRVVAENPPIPSHSVWLTIDAGLQAETQRLISEVYTANDSTWAPRSKGAAVVVMEVKTGAILAMVSHPTYDANAFLPFPPMGRRAANAIVEAVQRNPRTPQLNRPLQGTYTAGSVMKLSSSLAVVDSGVYPSTQEFVCVGTWNREDNFIRIDWKPDGHGLVNVQTAVAQSCNPFFYEVGYQMDLRDPFLLPNYFNRLGLGRLSGITDLPEEAGLIADATYVRNNYGLNWSFSRSVNMAIGQDIAITPFQIGRVTALIANGGAVYQPQLVLKTSLIGEAPSYELTPILTETLGISDEAFAVVRQGMCDVTTQRYGTAEYQYRHHRLHGVGVCGKTGTAQAPGEDVLPHAWFTAYAPANDPEVAVVVMVENAGEGSAVAAPLTRDILDYWYFGQFE